MAQSSCCTLCEEQQLDNININLKNTFTLYSKTLLFNFLQNCVQEKFLFRSLTVCQSCYNLMNELDNIKLRMKIIEDQFKTYLRKQKKHNVADYSNETIKIHSCSVTNTKDSQETTRRQDSDSFVPSSHSSQVSSAQLQEPTVFKSKKVVKLSKVSSTSLSCEINRKSKICHPLETYECMECHKTWKTETQLKSHLMCHNQVRPFICEICGQAYKRQHALSVHVGMHKGIYPFKCVHCSKSFTQKGALTRHIPIHTGELKYQCDLCGKRFVHHTSFNVHKLTHSGQKSYKCKICGLFFTSGSHLKRHMKVHTGEKKYACSTCNKKFAERYNLAVHEKMHLEIVVKREINK